MFAVLDQHLSQLTSHVLGLRRLDLSAEDFLAYMVEEILTQYQGNDAVHELQIHALGQLEVKDQKILVRQMRTLVSYVSEVINEDHLFNAIQMGKIAGAGLDVLANEPPKKKHKLTKLDNVIVTSHIAAYSDDFLYNFWRYSVDTIIDLSKKQWPKSCVNPVVNSRWGISIINSKYLLQ